MANEIKKQKDGRYSVRIGNQKFNSLSLADAQRKSDTNYQAQPDSVTDSPNQKAANRALGISPGDSDAMRDAAIRGQASVAPDAAQTPADTVDTGQPSPRAVPVGPQAVDEGAAQAAVASGYVASPQEYQNAVQAGQSLAERSRGAFQQVQSSGVQAPSTQGMAASAISSAMPTGQSFSHVDQMLVEDSGFQMLQQTFRDYFAPEAQKTSLVDEYKKLYKRSGLDDLDEEILDAKTIIEGTEDDIRNEIQAAGGFGTDSQVQALASSRNKVLLKNYNNLVAMRETKQQNFDTMMALTEKDRAYADQRADKMLNFQMQVLDYKQKFVDNARSNLVTMGQTLGWDTVYQSYANDPRQTAFAEQILGIGQGGLATAAQQYSQQRVVAAQKDELQLAGLRSSLYTDQLQQQKIINDMLLTQPSEQGNQRLQEVSQLAVDLLSPNATGKKSAVGTSFAKLVPDWLGRDRGLQGNRVSFENRVETLKSNLTLDNLKLLKGAMSDKDLAFLQSVGSSLSTGMSEKEFDKELYKVATKLDPVSVFNAGYVIDPETGNVIQIID